jgi:adenosylcobinamide-GDP ribazoletransferase
MVIWSRFAAAIVFYTTIPLPISGALEFQTVSKFAPLVGLLVGGLLGGLDQGLALVGIPPLTRSALIIVSWMTITGGLHLDGAMDTADGLAVTDPDRRLQVMADSATGAFGAMAAVALLLLKTTALSDLSQGRWLWLMLACGWGRWAQQVAIARYPYLKATGKGAFHKQAIQSFWDTLPSLLLLLGFSTLPAWLPAFLPHPSSLILLPSAFLLLPLSFLTIALLVPAWFHRKLGGHTGDTYGATVEWTEALILVGLTTLL